MESAVAADKPILDEGQQRSVLLVTVVKEGTDVADFSELGTGDANGRADRTHGVFLPYRGRPASISMRPQSVERLAVLLQEDSAATLFRRYTPYVKSSTATNS